MTDAEWEAHSKRAVLAAFQTGRPVFADTDGALHYADGAHEPIADDAGVPQAPQPEATATSSWWVRLKRRFRRRTPEDRTKGSAS